MQSKIFHRGTEINKIENEFPKLFGYDDFIYVSNGFLNATQRGLTPTSDVNHEFHHYFVKDPEYGFKAQKIYFN